MSMNPGAYAGYLTVYDESNPDGLAWGNMPIHIVLRPSDV